MKFKGKEIDKNLSVFEKELFSKGYSKTNHSAFNGADWLYSKWIDGVYFKIYAYDFRKHEHPENYEDHKLEFSFEAIIIVNETIYELTVSHHNDLDEFEKWAVKIKKNLFVENIFK